MGCSWLAVVRILAILEEYQSASRVIVRIAMMVGKDHSRCQAEAYLEHCPAPKVLCFQVGLAMA